MFMVRSHTFTFSVMFLRLSSLFAFPVCFLSLFLMSEAGVSCSVIACSALMCVTCAWLSALPLLRSAPVSPPPVGSLRVSSRCAFCPVFSVELMFVLNFGIFFHHRHHHHPAKLHVSLLSFSTTLHTTCCPCGILACLQSIPVSERFLRWP